MTAVVSARAPAAPAAPVVPVDPSAEPRRRLLVGAALALPVAALSTVPAWQFAHWQWIALTLAAPVVVWGAWPFHRAAVEQLRRGTASVDTPVSIGTLAALGWALHALLSGVSGAAPYLAVAAGGTVLALAGRYLAALVDGTVGPADRVAAAGTAILLAVAVGTLGFRLGSSDPAAAGAAIAVLVLACTPALAAATPTPLCIGFDRIRTLVGRPQVLASIRRADTVLIAGTGPLTSGRMSLHTAVGTDPDEALRLAGALGQGAPDPLASGLAAAARAAHGELPGASELDDLPGLGIRGLVSELDGEIVRAHAVLVGRPALLAEHGVDLPGELAAAVDVARDEGATAVVVAWDGTARAVLALTDTVRPGCAAVVARLRKLRIRPVLVAGEDVVAAARIAAAVGIEEADVVQRADTAGALLVADGFPDPTAPTFADLAAAVDAVRLARRAQSVIRWNLGLAVAATAAALPVAVAGLLSPAIAGLAMLASAAVVVINSLRLRLLRPTTARSPRSPIVATGG